MNVVSVSDEGTITVPEATLAQIAVQAAEQVEGVRVQKGRRRVAVELDDSGALGVDLQLSVAYGTVLPDAARDVQARVAAALGTMCAMDVRAVDVSIEELR